MNSSFIVPNPDLPLRFIHLYLIGYFVLVLGAAAALWQAGVIARLPVSWLVISAVVVIGLGILLAVSSSRPTPIAQE